LAPTHLLYADDVLIFCKGTQKNLKHIMGAFKDYGDISGQLVNWGKSSIYFGSSVSPSRIGSLQSLVGMQIGQLPFSYLGVPLFRGKPRKAVLQPIADKILSKFAKWKGKSLSLAGRATLIRSVITGSFVHSFMIYKWPSSLLSLINRKLRNFLWTGSCEETKLVRVAWDRCCRPYSQGGLGLKDLGLLNDSLLRKFTWKFMTSDGFAFSFLRERYLRHLQKPHGGYVTSSIWSSLRTNYSSLLKEGIWLIGESSQRDFWRDNWLGVPILELLGIPDYLAYPLRAKVSDFIHEGRWVLDDCFRARFPDLCFRIDRIAISPVVDSLVWANSRDGRVSCKAAYSQFLRDIPQVVWWRDVWSRFIPPSRSALTWRLMLNRLPTEDRLCKSGLQLASRCSICGVSSESVDHLFLHCPLAVALWEAVFSAFQCRVSTETWQSFFLQAMSVSFSEQIRILWKAAIHAVIWGVWTARNQWIFEGKSVDFRSVLSLVWRAVSEANRLDIGCMRNCMDDLLILRRFGLRGRPSKAPVIKSVVWSPPAPGWIKVNTDGAAIGSPGVGGCGGIFRNCRAFVKGCFAIPLGQVFAFEAELLAASLAINFAWKYGWHRIWLESDSSYVVQLLSSRSEMVPWRVRQAWQRCIFQISQMDFQVSHIFREGNQVADMLSKHALELQADSWWFSAPSFCSSLVVNDCMGRESFRFS
jgi:ribonuclease HI